MMPHYFVSFLQVMADKKFALRLSLFQLRCVGISIKSKAIIYAGIYRQENKGVNCGLYYPRRNSINKKNYFFQHKHIYLMQYVIACDVLNWRSREKNKSKGKRERCFYLAAHFGCHVNSLWNSMLAGGWNDNVSAKKYCDRASRNLAHFNKGKINKSQDFICHRI